MNWAYFIILWVGPCQLAYTPVFSLCLPLFAQIQGSGLSILKKLNLTVIVNLHLYKFKSTKLRDMFSLGVKIGVDCQWSKSNNRSCARCDRLTRQRAQKSAEKSFSVSVRVWNRRPFRRKFDYVSVAIKNKIGKRRQTHKIIILKIEIING